MPANVLKVELLLRESAIRSHPISKHFSADFVVRISSLITLLLSWESGIIINALGFGSKMDCILAWNLKITYHYYLMKMTSQVIIGCFCRVSHMILYIRVLYLILNIKVWKFKVILCNDRIDSFLSFLKNDV